MFYDGGEIGAPASKVIVHIERRNADAPREGFQGAKLFSHGKGIAKQSFGFRKFQIIYDINQEQCGCAFVRGRAV